MIGKYTNRNTLYHIRLSKKFGKNLDARKRQIYICNRAVKGFFDVKV